MKIVWRRWQDPLAPLARGHVPEEDEDDPGYHEACRSFGKEPRRLAPFRRRGAIGPCVFGPVGIVPVRESNVPGHLFNFWMGDTDFDLSGPVVDRIAAVPGVETLDVFTRYRFRMGIGRAFKEDDVRGAVDRSVLPAAPVAPAQIPPPGVASLAKKLARAFPHWAVVTTPRGVQGVGGATPEEVREKLSRLGAEGPAPSSWSPL